MLIETELDCSLVRKRDLKRFWNGQVLDETDLHDFDQLSVKSTKQSLASDHVVR